MLATATRLANQGHLDEAAKYCEDLLSRQTHQADAYYLLGVIREAAGNSEDAEQMFRRAVYLQPNYYEALVHLSVICERSGDPDGARRYLERAARAQSRQPQSGAAK